MKWCLLYSTHLILAACPCSAVESAEEKDESEKMHEASSLSCKHTARIDCVCFLSHTRLLRLVLRATACSKWAKRISWPLLKMFCRSFRSSSSSTTCSCMWQRVMLLPAGRRRGMHLGGKPASSWNFMDNQVFTSTCKVKNGKDMWMDHQCGTGTESNV